MAELPQPSLHCTAITHHATLSAKSGESTNAREEHPPRVSLPGLVMSSSTASDVELQSTAAVAPPVAEASAAAHITYAATG